MDFSASQDRVQEGSTQGNNQVGITRDYQTVRCDLLTPLQELNSPQPLQTLYMPEFPGECDICQRIWQLFAQPTKFIDRVELGTAEEALATQCHVYQPLVQAFIELTGTDRVSGDMITMAPDQGSILMFGPEPGQFWNLLLVKKDTVPHHHGIGRILNPDWVDLDMLKDMKKQCLSTHGARCENPLKIWATKPAYLIDVETKCLVKAWGGNLQVATGTFVALSYTYGRVSGTTMDADTFKALQNSYALDAPEFENYMSPVIKHAIYLTSAIGERYLWADAVCIPQDNEEAKNRELNMMGAIYANAVVTIIAADGDAQDGLPGLKGVSEPRQMNQHIIPFGSEKIIPRSTYPRHLSYGGDYHSRAWTFQEYRMSRRRIIFKNHELHWVCQCKIWHEDMILDADNEGYIDQGNTIIMAGFPDLESLDYIFNDYNERELSFEEDALPATSGLLSVLSRSFTGGFLYGIPEMFFERGLSWRPQFYRELQRRTPSKGPLPSWSWVGWQGPVYLSFSYWEAYCRDYSGGKGIEETIPVTEWYTSNSPSDAPENRRRIRSTWFENRHKYKDVAQPLPPGWSRHEAPVMGRDGGPWIYPDGCGKYTFKHADMPDPDTAFYYPFPVVEIKDSTQPFTPEQTPYLFCKTWRARLWGRKAEYWGSAELYNSSGGKVGELHLHNRKSWALFPDTDSEAGHGLPVELVTVYKSRNYERRGDVDGGHSIERYDMHIVLWVEYKDGVAYRLASGQVRTEEWEKLDTEGIDLVLG